MPLFELFQPLMDIYGGKPWVLCWPRAGGAHTFSATLQELGAPPPFVLASRLGKPWPADVGLAGTTVLAGCDGADDQDPDMIAEFRVYERRMAQLPASALDRWDPRREARVLAPTGTVLREVAGRPVYGTEDLKVRQQVEDKCTVAALWDAAGVPQAPATVVPLSEAVAAACHIDRGQGTVWAGDNHSHIEGGAIATRWVHDQTSQDAALKLFLGRCCQVRVMPYVPGVPCAIQGFCTPDGVAIFEPMEMVVLVDRAQGAFQFCGVSTLWTPSAAVRDNLRQIGRRVGERLRTHHGWRGGFSVDGIVPIDDSGAGFVPTEVNARFSGGLIRLDEIHGGPPLALVHRALQEGALTGLDGAALERTLGGAARRRRICAVHLAFPTAPPQTRTVPIALDRPGCPQDEDGDGLIKWQDAGGFGVINLETDALRTRPGPPIGPRFAAALQTAAAQLGIDIGKLASPAASDCTR